MNEDKTATDEYIAMNADEERAWAMFHASAAMAPARKAYEEAKEEAERVYEAAIADDLENHRTTSTVAEHAYDAAIAKAQRDFEIAAEQIKRDAGTLA